MSHFSSLSSHSVAMNHHMDNSLLPMSHSSSNSIESVAGTNSFSATPRKFTLLARPQQQQLTSGNVSMSFQSSLPSSDTYNGQIIEGNLNQSSLIPPTGSVQGRATRDDYYDTEDPSVNLLDFIVNSLQSQKNKPILMKLEEEFRAYIADQSRTDPMKLPPWDSYHRMLAHRTAAFFGLEHNVDPVDKTRVLVGKGPNTRMPQVRFMEYLTLTEDTDSPEPKLILKRAPSDTTSVEKPFGSSLVSVGSSSADVKLPKSYEEREEEYEKARARIFDQPSPLQSIVSFDLATQSTPRLSSSILHSAMHHRRAASDTAMFKRLAPAEAKKEGSSSSQGSRSATPLVSSMLKPAGSCELPFSSFSSHVQPPLQSKTSPKSLPQQVHNISFDSQGPSSHYHSQTTSSASISSSPPKFLTSSINSPAQHSNDQVLTTTITASSPTALHFQPVQPPQHQNHPHHHQQHQQQQQQQQQAAIPMMYGHPQPTHPQATMMADPNWYYQQMMLYQMPQGYVQPPYVGGASAHIIQHMYNPYSMGPGVMNQHGMVSPPVTSQQQLGSVGPRLPVDHMASASHSALVKPVPQQASPVRVPNPKVDGAWSFSPGSGAPPFNMAQHSMVAQQVAMSGGTAAPLPVSASHMSPAQVAEQLENSLHISTSGRDSFGLEGDVEAVISRDSNSASISSKMKYSEGGEVDSTGMMGQQMMSRIPNGPFSLPLGGDQLFGGQVMSPTHPQGPVHFIPSQPAVYGASNQEGASYVGNQAMMPSNTIHLPAGNPSQPSTPTMGALNLGQAAMLQQQGIFSPPTSGITHSPVQILGHSLGTSLFSPPPSTGNQHGVFINSPTSSGKIGYTPTHPPVGSGTHINEVTGSMTPQTANGYQALPPRLAQQQHVQKSGNRYQNQRHPSNRANKSSHSTGGSVTLGDHMPSQFVGVPSSTGPSGFPKREPLLPTPPSNQMVKLDTNLTCGVPLHVMEVVGYPMEGTPERAQANELVSKISGMISIKSGKMPKTGEDVTIVLFSSQEAAMHALKVKLLPQLSLSIPRSNHAKFILTLL